MDTKEICYLSATQLSSLIQKKELSPVEIVEAHLERIDALEPTLNSFITLLPEQALATARQAEHDIQSGKYLGPLHGIPLALKDMICSKGVRNTSGFKGNDNFIPNFDATVAAKLKEAGVILMGKLNMHQLAYGITGENPDYGHMHNPWNPALITGGSSGGSASAVASGQCTLTIAGDTGGSVRIPSALCGLAGLKPTYGRVSRHGIPALSWSQDHPGPMARTVSDCALLMNTIAGYDPNDLASVHMDVPDYTQGLNGDVRGLRIGVPKEYFEVPIDAEVEQLTRDAIEVLGSLGATITEISWPMYHQAMAISTTIQMVEATAYHRDLVRSRGPELYPPVRLLLEAGFFISGQEFLQAQRARTRFGRETLDLFDTVDILAGPMQPITAHGIGAVEVQVGDTVMGSRSALTQYTRPFNLNGFPAMSIPCGLSKDGLPTGLQLAGKPFDEATVLKVAYAYEQATEWHTLRPPI